MLIRQAVIVAILIGGGTLGCALSKRTSQDLPPAFLQGVDAKSKKENLPFDQVWVKPGARKSSYNSIYFKPVRVDLLPSGSWANSASAFIVTEQDYMDKAREVAEYFHGQLVDKTSQPDRSARQLAVVNSPDRDTLIVEPALTELEFSHPIARAGSIPFLGAGPALSAVSDPHVAFAARLTDGNTGELVATVADRKFAPARLLDLNKLTVSSSPREICSLWADEIAKAVQSEPGTKVSETRFSLLPW